MSTEMSEDIATEYFATLNPIARKISIDIDETKSNYEHIWNQLSPTEQTDIINETLIRPEIALRYFDNFSSSSSSVTLSNAGEDGNVVDDEEEEEEEYRRRAPVPNEEAKLKKSCDKFNTKNIYNYDGKNICSYSGQKTGSRIINDEVIGAFRDEHSAPFSYKTKSQINLKLFSDSNANCKTTEVQQALVQLQKYQKLSQSTKTGKHPGKVPNHVELKNFDKIDGATTAGNYERFYNDQKITNNLTLLMDSTTLATVVPPDADDVKGNFLSKFICKNSLIFNAGTNLIIKANQSSVGEEDEGLNLIKNISYSGLTSSSSVPSEEEEEKQICEDSKLLLENDALRKGFDFLNNCVPVKMLMVKIILICVLFDEPQISSGSIIVSPCPKIFQYRFDGAQWHGEVSLRGHQFPGVVHLKVILSLRGRPPTDFIGEIQLINCDDFVELNCSNSSQLFYKIKFPRSRISVPKIAQILVNGRVICVGSGDREVLVTLIQLEHIRNRTFFVDDGKAAVLVRDDDQLMNVTRIRDTCGRGAPLAERGQQISRGSWPWLAAVYFHNLTTLEYRCGGTLISRRLVISAAHCFHTPKKRHSPARTVVALGRWDLTTWTEKGSILAGVEEIHIHPDYDETGASYDADLAIILLDEAVPITDFIRPVCLWPAGGGGELLLDVIVGERGFLVGWGHNRNRPLRPTPKKSSVVVVSQATCLKSNIKFKAITSRRTFCAGDRNGSGPCSGDSGTGFVLKRDSRWTLRGIVSASLPPNPVEIGNDFCNLNEFIVYSDVAQFLDWIYLFLDTYG